MNSLKALLIFVLSLFMCTSQASVFTVTPDSVEAEQLLLEEKLKVEATSFFKKFIPDSAFSVQVSVDISPKRTIKRQPRSIALDKLGRVASVGGGIVVGPREVWDRVNKVEFHYLITSDVDKEAMKSVESMTPVLVPLISRDKIQVSVHPMPVYQNGFSYSWAFLLGAVLASLLFLTFAFVFFKVIKNLLPEFNKLPSKIKSRGRRLLQRRAPVSMTDEPSVAFNFSHINKEKARGRNRLASRLQSLAEEAKNLGPKREAEIFQRLRRQGKLALQKLFMLYYFPQSEIVNLPDHLLRHFLSKLDFSKKVTLLAAVEESIANALLSVLASDDPAEQKLIALEVSAVKKQQQRKDAAQSLEAQSAWPQFVDLVRSEIRDDESLRAQVEEHINESMTHFMYNHPDEDQIGA